MGCEPPEPLADAAFARAPTWPELERLLAEAGFASVEYADREPELPGYERGIVSAHI